MLCCDRCIEGNPKKYFRTTGSPGREHGTCNCCGVSCLCMEGMFTDSDYRLVGYNNARQKDQMQLLAETLELEGVERGTSEGNEYYIVSTESGLRMKIQSVRDYEITSIYVTRC